MTTMARAGALNQLRQLAGPLQAQPRRLGAPRGTEGALQAPQTRPQQATGARARTGDAQPVSSASGIVYLLQVQGSRIVDLFLSV